MASAEEIRERVKRADEQRIATRADAAARVGEIANKRDELRAKLAELDKALSSAVSDALTVMTADELAQFTGRQHREIDEWTTGGKSSSRRRSTPNRPDRSPRRSSRTARPTASTPNQPAADTSGPATETTDGTVGTVTSPVTP
ncbi:MAG: hypothetical protein ACRDRU_22075 [Pseudonocardiaceae bacterium]